jgi:two-component system sensor histidine kinase NblS
MGQLMKEKDTNKIGFLNMNNQNKIIVFGWFLSSVLIFATALLVIGNTQKKIFQSYYDFGLMLTKTLAIESVDLTANLTDEQKTAKFEQHADRLLKNNKDIEHIIFKNSQGNVIYSSDSGTTATDKSIEISTPMIAGIKGKDTVVGSVQIGFTGNSMKEIGKTTRNSMIIIFTVVWLISMFAVLVNTLLITRQITLLGDGVRRISSGEFGYKLNAKDLWGEIKQLFDAFNDMSVRLRQYEDKNIDQLTYEKNKLEAVLMSIANGVVACDNYDNVILVNNSALSMLNVKSKEIVGSKIQAYCDSDGHTCFEEHIEKFKDTPLEEMERTPLEFQAEIDQKLYKAFVSPIFTLSQEYLGYIMILHDITKEAEIDKIKSNFISNVSHELRTPVTVLRSYIETLHNYNDEFDEKTKKEFLSIMNQEADRLNKMVNDILDFSRLESPNIKLKKEFCDIKPIIELTVSSMSVLAAEKNLLFSIIVEPELPKVYINTDSIERVLKNLLSNAIKYSNSSGKIKARAELGRSGKYIEISIEDNGIGLAQEHLEKIFDRFYRVENQVHTVKGTGLGLHLVKIAIEKHHNGQVFVESEDGIGSKFGFRLPLDVEVEEEETPPAIESNKHHETRTPIDSEKFDNDWEITIEKS